VEIKDFNAVRVSLASPEEILSWSYGEVTKPETINYRRLRPERDGLFCEAIFGPQRDWQCYCGKYKKVRFKGIRCDKCGVEVTRSAVRRERMGHIGLASPVAHIWYTRRVPSYLGLLLDISRRNLDRVLYFAQYVITHIDEKERQKAIDRLEAEREREVAKRREAFDGQLSDLERVADERIAELRENLAADLERLDRQQEERVNEVMGVAAEVRERLNRNVGRRAEEDIVFKPLDLALVMAGEDIPAGAINDLNTAIEEELNKLEARIDQQKRDKGALNSAQIDQLGAEIDERKKEVQARIGDIISEVQLGHSDEIEELRSLRVMQFLNEAQYRDLYEKYGNIFDADMGAEALYEIVRNLDLAALARELRAEIKKTRSKQRRKKATKRLKVVNAFQRSGNRPEWMILTVLPVIPPDLRPMVQLDGGRFATSDLNDLYRRVINRNNRLKRLLDLDAPDVIIRNEKRMLQEAVDSLIDNSRRGKAVSLRGKRKLKSLSDMLKGKQGRFRRNLLGKRVDYSGRSVIVVGPHLKLHECGLPKKMALELFKPFVIHRLVEENFAPNVKGAKRFIEQMRPEVWGILEQVIEGRPVLLNRAPTLHRLGIQAFMPRLIDGSAIELHPLACSAFNADFDGDQMALHVPLSDKAVEEAMTLMLSSKNLLKPADGEPTVSPTKDMVLGCYYLTQMGADTLKGAGRFFSEPNEAMLAYELGQVHLQAPIKVRVPHFFVDMDVTELALSEESEEIFTSVGIYTVDEIVARINDNTLDDVPGITDEALRDVTQALDAQHIEPERFPNNRIYETTVGRVIFNEVVPPEMGFQNDRYHKGGLKDLVADCYDLLGLEQTAAFSDALKDLGFKYATRSGVTLAVDDISVPEQKQDILSAVEQQVEQVDRQYRRGLITEEEQYRTTVQLWTEAKDVMTSAVEQHLNPFGPLAVMSNSGAVKGGIQPLAQLAGMRGLMADPNGRIIPLPIRSNFREGLNPLEYFISTHGARKGLADTALRTADAGYLTRRLVDVAQDMIIREQTCGTREGLLITTEQSLAMGVKLSDRIIGRFTAGPVVHPDTGEILLDGDTFINERVVRQIIREGVQEISVRSPLTCQLRAGICMMCYGRDLGRGGLVGIGEAVGIIAAQSIGEPGTQLTLRTFHTGGVAGVDDITQGLPRITELFEARNPKGEAILAEIGGRVEIEREGDLRVLRIIDARSMADTVSLNGHEVVVEDGDLVKRGDLLARSEEGTVEAPHDGVVLVEDGQLVVRYDDKQVVKYDVPPTARLRVDDGQIIPAGSQLTEGAKNPHQVLKISGIDAVQAYLVEQVQEVYRSQGVSIHDKHIEIIVRNMLRRVRVKYAGDTDFLLGDLVDRLELEDVNRRIMERGGQPAIAEPVLLGITKAALNTDSFLSASSFQHTINVLAQAAIEGKVDNLEGLKENVIIGKLIPAGTGYRAVEEEDPEIHIRQREEGEEEYEFSLDDLDDLGDFDDFDDFDDLDEDELELDTDEIDEEYDDEDAERRRKSYLEEEEEEEEDEDEDEEEDEEEDELIDDVDPDLIPEADIDDEELVALDAVEIDDEAEEEDEEEGDFFEDEEVGVADEEDEL
jgi:DNA-directed RNA polymerase subunit beta'